MTGKFRATSRRWWLVAIAVAIVVRGWHVARSDFPLNDGGMFLAMTADLEANGFRLPRLTTYNAADIPFAYAPLGFFVAGVADRLTPGGLVTVFRWLPLAVSVLLVASVYQVAREFAGRDANGWKIATAAAIAYALTPRAFVWLIMGGGLTRGLGLLFSSLALIEANRLFRDARWRHAVTLGLCVAAAALSHLGTMPFLLLSLIVLFLARGRSRTAIQGAALGAVISVAGVAPWFLWLQRTHGLAPLRHAASTNQSALSSVSGLKHALVDLARFGMSTSGEPLFPLVVVLALVGLVLLVHRRAWLIPLWWIATIAAGFRGGNTYAAIPLALLAGVGVVDGVLLWSADHRGFATRLLVGMGAYAFLGSVATRESLGSEVSYLRGLSGAERETMHWFARNTPESSRVLLVPTTDWATDRWSEWFPVIARRSSVATAQGTEWLPGGAFARAVDSHSRLATCGSRGLECLARWSAEEAQSFDYLVLWRTASECCAPLESALRASSEYELVRQSADALVFRVRGVSPLTSRKLPVTPAPWPALEHVR